MNAKEEARAALIDELLLLLDHKSSMTLARIKAEAYAAECVVGARAPLVEALELVEWIDCVVGDGDDEDSWRECACCRNRREQGHTEDCPIAAALAKETP